MTNKVQFTPDGVGGVDILINDMRQAHISSGPEKYLVYVENENDRLGIVLARFKYVKPLQKAKAFCKVVFGTLDMEIVVDQIQRGVLPLHLQQRVEAGEVFVKKEFTMAEALWPTK